jgi:hypothetical protein
LDEISVSWMAIFQGYFVDTREFGVYKRRTCGYTAKGGLEVCNQARDPRRVMRARSVGLKGSTSGTVRHWSTAIALVLSFAAGPSIADVTVERGSSIIVFPKVIFDSGAVTGKPAVDTIIQITNTSNSIVFAHCYYINALPVDPRFPPSETNPPRWQEINFDIFLTKQQPTHWLVAQVATIPQRRCLLRRWGYGDRARLQQAGFDEVDPVDHRPVCRRAPLHRSRLVGRPPSTATTSRANGDRGGAIPALSLRRTEISKCALGMGLNTDELEQRRSNPSAGGDVRPGCRNAPSTTAVGQGVPESLRQARTTRWSPSSAIRRSLRRS